jgi:virulence-associated protein VapD
MEYLIGALLAVFFFCTVIGSFYSGYKQGKKVSAPIPLDDEKKRQMERFDKGFKEIFSYDVEKALQKKKVT